MFLNELENYLSHDASEEVLKVVIDWGRYAELIGYSPEDQQLYLDQLD